MEDLKFSEEEYQKREEFLKFQDEYQIILQLGEKYYSSTFEDFQIDIHDYIIENNQIEFSIITNQDDYQELKNIIKILQNRINIQFNICLTLNENFHIRDMNQMADFDNIFNEEQKQEGDQVGLDEQNLNQQQIEQIKKKLNTFDHIQQQDLCDNEYLNIFFNKQESEFIKLLGQRDKNQLLKEIDNLKQDFQYDLNEKLKIHKYLEKSTIFLKKISSNEYQLELIRNIKFKIQKDTSFLFQNQENLEEYQQQFLNLYQINFEQYILLLITYLIDLRYSTSYHIKIFKEENIDQKIKNPLENINQDISSKLIPIIDNYIQYFINRMEDSQSIHISIQFRIQLIQEIFKSDEKIIQESNLELIKISLFEKKNHYENLFIIENKFSEFLIPYIKNIQNYIYQKQQKAHQQSKIEQNQINIQKIESKISDLKKQFKYNQNQFNHGLFNYYLNQGQQYENQVKEKDVIVLIGMTGSGKSLTINFLKGLKIIQIKTNTGNYLLDIEESQKKNAAEVGHKITSQTEFFQVFQILEGMMALDTAGFSDTKCPELEIAQSISLINSLKKSNSVKIILVIEKDAFFSQRSDGLKKILDVVLKLFQNLNECFNSIMTIVTKVEQKFNEENFANVLDQFLNLEDQDPIFMNLIKFLVKGFREKTNMIINPIEQPPIQLINKIKNLLPLQNPSQYLRLSLTSEAFQKLRNYVYELKENIQKYFSEKNFEFLAKEMNILFQLSQIELEYIQQEKEEIIQSFTKQYKVTYHEIIERVEREHSRSSISDEQLQELSKFDEELNNFLNNIGIYIQNITLDQSFIKEDLKQKILQSTISQFQIQKLTNLQSDEIDKFLIESKQNLKKLLSCSKILKIFLNNDEKAKQLFDELILSIKQQRQQFKDLIIIDIRSLMLEKSKYLAPSNIQLSDRLRSKIQSIENSIEKFNQINSIYQKSQLEIQVDLNSQELIKYIEELEQIIRVSIQSSLDKLNFYGLEDLNKKENYPLYEITLILELQKSNFIEKQFIKINDISNEIQNQFVQLVREKLQNLNYQIKVSIEEKDFSVDQQELQKQLRKIIYLRKLTIYIEEETRQEFKIFNETIQEILKELSNNIIQPLKQDLSSLKSKQMKRNKRLIEFMFNFEWLDKELGELLLKKRGSIIRAQLQEYSDDKADELNSLYAKCIKNITVDHSDLIHLEKHYREFLDIFQNILSQNTDQNVSLSNQTSKLKKDLTQKIEQFMKQMEVSYKNISEMVENQELNWNQIIMRIEQLKNLKDLVESLDLNAKIQSSNKEAQNQQGEVSSVELTVQDILEQYENLSDLIYQKLHDTWNQNEKILNSKKILESSFFISEFHLDRYSGQVENQQKIKILLNPKFFNLFKNLNFLQNQENIDKIFYFHDFQFPTIKNQIRDMLDLFIQDYDNIQADENKLIENQCYQKITLELQRNWSEYYEKLKFYKISSDSSVLINAKKELCLSLINNLNFKNLEREIKQLMESSFPSQQSQLIEKLEEKFKILQNDISKDLKNIINLIQQDSEFEEEQLMLNKKLKNLQQILEIVEKLAKFIEGSQVVDELKSSLYQINNDLFIKLEQAIKKLEPLLYKEKYLEYCNVWNHLQDTFSLVKQLLENTKDDRIINKLKEIEQIIDLKRIQNQNFNLEERSRKIDSALIQTYEEISIARKDSKSKEFFRQKLDDLNKYVKSNMEQQIQAILKLQSKTEQQQQLMELEKKFSLIQLYNNEKLGDIIQKELSKIYQNQLSIKEKIFQTVKEGKINSELKKLLVEQQQFNLAQYNEINEKLFSDLKFLKESLVENLKEIKLNQFNLLLQDLDQFKGWKNLKDNLIDTQLILQIEQIQESINSLLKEKQSQTMSILKKVFELKLNCSKNISIEEQYYYLQNFFEILLQQSVLTIYYNFNDNSNQIFEFYSYIIKSLEKLEHEYILSPSKQFQDFPSYLHKIKEFSIIREQLVQEIPTNSLMEKLSFVTDQNILNQIKNLQEQAKKVQSSEELQNQFKKLIKEKSQNILIQFDLWNLDNFNSELKILISLTNEGEETNQQFLNDILQQIQLSLNEIELQVINGINNKQFREINDSVKKIKEFAQNYQIHFKFFSLKILNPQENEHRIIQAFNSTLEMGKQEVQNIVKQNKVNEQEIKKIYLIFIEIQNILFQTSYFKEEVKLILQKMSSLVKIYKKELIKVLGMQFLNGDHQQISHEILKNCKEFTNISREEFKKMLIEKSFKEILKNFRRTIKSKKQKEEQIFELNRPVLKKRYDQFKAEFGKNIDIYLGGAINKKDDLKNSLKELSLGININKWDNNSRSKVMQIFINVASIWSILDHEEMGGDEKFYIEPNNAQIMAILFLLNLDCDEEFWKPLASKFGLSERDAFQNQFSQVLTGEGKSIIIGLISTVLSLLGFEVHAVCYSSYLSERDYTSFQTLFKFLDLDDHIFYGTFNQMSEIILQKKFDLRQKTLELIRSNYKIPEIDENMKRRRLKNENRKSILIIDEVDVFFSEHFYGKTFNPVAPYTCQEIRNILVSLYEKGYIYHQKKQIIDGQILYEEIKVTDDYIKLISDHKDWKEIFDQNVRLMIVQVKEFLELGHKYHYDRQIEQIGYEDADRSISYKISYGYLTQFAYIQENKENNFSKKLLEEKLFIPIKCGNLSFAEVPKKQQYYQRILGVTGTLETLHPLMKQILNDYNINLQTFTPSIFTESNISFQKNNQEYFSVEFTQENWIQKIMRLVQSKFNNLQAILIFFESNQKIQEFKKQIEKDAKMNSYLQVIDESVKEKEVAIKKATHSRMISLLIREMGRGTDFLSKDSKVIGNGGTVVIQTFLSMDYSEQVQIRGRAGRQGQSGSYHLFLFSEDLQSTFSIPNDEQKYKEQFHNGQLYDELDKIRNDQFGNYIKNYQKFVEDSLVKHSNTERYIKNAKLKTVEAIELVKDLNKIQIKLKKPDSKYNKHYILVLDDSGSMQAKDGKQTSRWQQLLECCKILILTASEQDIISVIFHGSDSRVIIKYKQIKESIQEIEQAKVTWSGNSFFKAIDTIAKLIEKIPFEKQDYLNVIVFISDGGDCDSGVKRNESLDKLFKTYKNKISQFNTIGQGPNAESGILKEMSDKAKSYGIPSEMNSAVNQEILEEEFIKISSWEPQAIN